jgi:hypothetical protein
MLITCCGSNRNGQRSHGASYGAAAEEYEISGLGAQGPLNIEAPSASIDLSEPTARYHLFNFHQSNALLPGPIQIRGAELNRFWMTKG